MTTYYKVVASGHKACHGGDFTYRPNRWTPRIENIVACERGYHVCTIDQLSRWLYADLDSQLPLEVWECKADGVTDVGDKCVAERVILKRLVITLDEYDLRWLGTLFAEAVLENTDDPRVGECINAVRAYSLGFSNKDGLSAAESAARRAAWGAAESAAWSAARSAAWSAARRAAWGAAESAARSAAWSAARRAAWGAVRSAAESAAWSAAGSAERSAQGQAILAYIEAVTE